MSPRKLGRGATGLPRYYMDVGWWRSRRFAGLPLEAIGLMSCIVGYGTEHATDGRLPANHEDLAAALGVRATAVRRAIAPLLERGVLVPISDDEGEALVVRSWEDHNPTKAEVEAWSSERASSGAKGNHQRWHAARGIVDPACPWCDSPTDRNSESPPDRCSDPSAIANRSHGMGWDRNTDTSSSDTSTTRPVDDDPVSAAIAILAQGDLARRQSEKGPVGNPTAWLRTASNARRKDHARTLHALHRQHPDWTPPVLASAILEQEQPVPDSPADGTVAAQAVAMERNARRASGDACQACDDTGWVPDDIGTGVHPCGCPLGAFAG